jgi:hypothetical protein
MKKNLKQMQSHASYGKSAMEIGDHSKNGASLKSLMSRGNTLRIFLIVIILSSLSLSCEKEEEQSNEANVSDFYAII